MPGIATKARCTKGQKKPTMFWLYENLVMLGPVWGERLYAGVNGVALVSP
jgi:hypothetical protein